MKILPVAKNVQKFAKNMIDNKKYTVVKPIKNYEQYMKTYGLK